MLTCLFGYHDPGSAAECSSAPEGGVREQAFDAEAKGLHGIVGANIDERNFNAASACSRLDSG
jgi:hypothetical protein